MADVFLYGSDCLISEKTKIVIANTIDVGHTSSETRKTSKWPRKFWFKPRRTSARWENNLRKKSTKMKWPILVETQVALTLYYLSDKFPNT